MIMFLDPFVTVLAAPPVPASAVRWARLVIFRGARLLKAENLPGQSSCLRDFVGGLLDSHNQLGYIELIKLTAIIWPARSLSIGGDTASTEEARRELRVEVPLPRKTGGKKHNCERSLVRIGRLTNG